MNRDYYNYLNNNYNIPNFEKQNTIYDMYNGYIRGNIFPQLYNTYMEYEPFEVKMKDELKDNIDILTFNLVDLGLFLDINPNNVEANKVYKDYEVKLKEYTDIYTKKYGPLTILNTDLYKNNWEWNNSPWPWEN